MGCQTFFMPLGDGHEHWTSHVRTRSIVPIRCIVQSVNWSTQLVCLRRFLFFHMANPVINQPCYSTENHTNNSTSRSPRNKSAPPPFEVMNWGDDVACEARMHVRVQTR